MKRQSQYNNKEYLTKSNAAISAGEDGLLTISEFSKTKLKNWFIESDTEVVFTTKEMDELLALNVKELKICLEKIWMGEGHHTSAAANKTKYYNLDNLKNLGKIDPKLSIKELIAKWDKENVDQIVEGHFFYYTKSAGIGLRHKQEFKDAILKGNWIYLKNGTKKKKDGENIDGNKKGFVWKNPYA